MKKIYTTCYALSSVALICLQLSFNNLQGQGCVNADFSEGNFTGWTGTYSAGQCAGIPLFGICAGCSATNPLNTVGFNQGPNDKPPSVRLIAVAIEPSVTAPA